MELWETIYKCCRVWTFFLIVIFVIEITVMKMAAYSNLPTFSLDKNKKKEYNLQMFLDLILFVQVRQIWGHQSPRSGLTIKSGLTLQIPALIEMIKSYLSINAALDFRRKIVQFNY